MDLTPLIEKTDMKTTWANIDKAYKLLKWKPTVNLETGIKRTVEWYLENKKWVSGGKVVGAVFIITKKYRHSEPKPKNLNMKQNNT